MINNKENEEFANLEAKNFKYWTEFYSKESKFSEPFPSLTADL